MYEWKKNNNARINKKILFILILVVTAIGASLVASRQILRNILSKKSLEAGQAAFANKDWVSAYTNFQEYLGRNPDDVEILRKYAEAKLLVRPVNSDLIAGAISAYRRIMQLDPKDESVYEKLVQLYGGIGNYEELKYIADKKLEFAPNDKNAPLWKADALLNMNKIQEAQVTLQQLINDIESSSKRYPDEYVKACFRMSICITDVDSSSEAAKKALEWLDKAVDYADKSAEAYVNRARFYCDTLSDHLVAKKDLEKADTLNPENPKIRYVSAAQWITLGKYEKAAAEVEAVDKLSQQTLQKYYLDIKDAEVARFLLLSDLALRQGKIKKAVSLADASLPGLTEERHRIQVLPSAVRVYAIDGNDTQARKYLEEYLDDLKKIGGTYLSSLKTTYLQALVAFAEKKPYLVINLLQPAVVNNANAGELWQLLGQAFSRTNQHRRAIDALTKYLTIFPKDFEMLRLLAKEYSVQKQWSKAYENAAEAESLVPDDINAQLLRIESGLHLAIENPGEPNVSALEKFSSELAKLQHDNPNEIDVRILHAAIYEYLREPEKTEKELKQAIADLNNVEDSNKPMKIEIQLANFYKRNKRLSEAIAAGREITEKYPKSAEPWLFLSDMYLANSENDKVRDCLEEGLKSVVSKNDKHSLSIKLALFELARGDQKAGKQLLEKIAEEDNQEIEARELLLELRENQQDSIQAQKLIDQIKSIEGQTGLRWRVYQAKLWLSLDQWRTKQEDISDYLQNCISHDPGWTAPVLLLVDLYNKQGDVRRIEEICRQAIARNPLAFDVTNVLLNLLESQGRFSEAQEILQRMDTNQKLFNAWQIRLALNTGDVSSAIDQLKVRASSNKKDANSRIQLAWLIYQQTKDANQAFTYLDEAQAIVPDSAVIKQMRAVILKKDGRSEEAMKIIDEYVKKHNDFDAYYLRGMYLADEGKYELAENDYKKLTSFADKGIRGYELLSNFYYDSNQPDKAISVIKEGLDKYPADLSLERDLMKLLVIEGPTQNLESANSIIKVLEEKLPDDSEIKMYKAAVLMINPTGQSMEAAKKILDGIIKSEPMLVKPYLMLIDISLTKKDYEAARNYANQALGANPGNQAFKTAQSRIELQAGNSELAAALAHNILQENSDNTEAIDIYVRASLNSGNASLLKEAKNLVEKALGRNPNNEKLLIAKSNILRSMGQAKEAIPGLEAYCKKEPGSKSVAALVNLAELYRITGDFSEAEQKINQVSLIDPNNLSVIHARFLLLVAEKNYDKLSGISDSYISSENQNITILLNAATILLSLDSRNLKEDGLKLFEHAAEISPDSPDTNYSLASALYRMGKKEQAVTTYRELLKKFPNDIRAMNDLAWIIQEDGQNYNEALDLANKGLQIAPYDLHLLDTRGTILSKNNQLNEAKKDFERIIEWSTADIDPQQRQKARALLKVGRVCVTLNALAEAKKHFQRALEIDQKSNVLTQAEREEIKKIIK